MNRMQWRTEGRIFLDAFRGFMKTLADATMVQSDGSRRVVGIGGATMLSAAAQEVMTALCQLQMRQLTRTGPFRSGSAPTVKIFESDDAEGPVSEVPRCDVRVRSFRIGPTGIDPMLVEIASRLSPALGFPLERWNRAQAANPGGNHQRFLVNDVCDRSFVMTLESVDQLLRTALGDRADLEEVARAFDRAMNDPMALLAVHDAVERFFVLYSEWRAKCERWRATFAGRENKWVLYGGENPSARYIPSQSRGFLRSLDGPPSPLGLGGEEFGMLPPEEQGAIDVAILLAIRDNDQYCHAVGPRMPPVADEMAYLTLMEHASRAEGRLAEIRLARVLAWLPQAAELRRNRQKKRLRGDKAQSKRNADSLAKRMREILQESPESRGWTVKAWARRLGCATGTVSGLPPWKAIMAERRGSKPRTARLSDKSLANISTEGKVGRSISQSPKEDELDRLIQEQERDAKKDASPRSRNWRSDNKKS